ncbi:COG3 [Cordylochernes scorpioides]|uniref:Conserved oligomeric Golgi complex subunit 3 n=1 Tax=Cordylochernes scorpioides TaxID=51811 RepID=A0ABY6K1T2_9ARAC|nr:COG3 [Cordylochernes scorpioides]
MMRRRQFMSEIIKKNFVQEQKVNRKKIGGCLKALMKCQSMLLLTTRMKVEGAGISLTEWRISQQMCMAYLREEYFSFRVVFESKHSIGRLYSQIENEKLENEIQKYNEYKSHLLHLYNECNKMVNGIDTALSNIDTLKSQYKFVSDKTTALHQACENLMEEQSKLVSSCEAITQNLNYFTSFETLSQKLGSPTITVLSESFIPILTKIDECLIFLENHSQYKEAGIYSARFRHLQTNALGMIRTYVMNVLQTTRQQILGQYTDLGPSENAYTLYYSKFCTQAPRILSLMKQIEQRVETNKDYEQLLSDCHQCYFVQREAMLNPSVESTFKDLVTKHQKDRCALMRSSCVFLIHLCQDEYALYHQFFSQTSNELNEFLIKICGRFYDILRSVIVQIAHLETLAELCSILKVEMLDEHVNTGTKELVAFDKVTRQLLQDVQEKLVYRAYEYIRSDIMGYTPAPGDLAYPEKLEMMESIAQSMVQEQRSRSSSISSLTSIPALELHSQFSAENSNPAILNVTPASQASSVVSESIRPRRISNSPADMHGMWYPTVRRTLVCLSKLYRCLDKVIFQGICQEALDLCIESLVQASNAISSRKTILDGQLFQIKHLLILREQIAPFQIDFSLKEATIDFSKIKDAAYNLFSKKQRLLSLSSNNAILEFLVQGTPQIIEQLVDSKKAIDTQLKLVCEDFISHTTTSLVGKLLDFLARAQIILQVQKDEPARNVTLSNQPFATPQILATLISKVYRNIKSTLPNFHRQLSLYLANMDTQYILFRPIKARVQTAFEQTIQIIRTNYSEEDQLIIACPSLEQINILLSASSK